MLTTNDRIIKLWKFDYRHRRKYSKTCVGTDGSIKMPAPNLIDEGYDSIEKSQYRYCHNYNINFMSSSPDCEQFLSSDDLRVNLWNVENNYVAYNLVDLKPNNIEDLSEVITHLEYHPKRSDMFIFSSSKGYISRCDLRISSQYGKFS